MTAETSSRVSVVIVSFNSSETLQRCLDCLGEQTYQNFRVILIDNASTEKPGGLLSHRPFSATYLEMQENLGFAEAMNRGLAVADGSLLAALNPDAFPAPEWLAELVAAANRHKDVAAFGSLQLSAASRDRIDGFGDHYLIWGMAWRGQTRPKLTGQIGYCFGVCAAAALYRTEALRAVGAFDGRLFCFYEDVDVAFRLRLAGHQCAVVPSAIVEHVGGASFEGKSALAEFLMARNQWWVLIKNMPWPLLMIALPGYAVLQILSSVRNPNSDRRRGLWAALRQTPAFWRERRRVQAGRKISARALSRWLSWSLWAFRRKESLCEAPQGPGWIAPL